MIFLRSEAARSESIRDGWEENPPTYNAHRPRDTFYDSRRDEWSR